MLAEKTNFTITRMVRLLEVSRSGYYVWLDRKPSDRMIRREGIEQKVAWFHGDSDEGQFLLVVANPEQGETNGQICTEQDAGSG
ncbi:hypothetical protein [Cryobacterium sp. Hh38]|uniref:hypothetical protein n=1 Tax=Cryobacterium sp. Hh38 TaxID=1259156 RepID=UPI00106B172B|nr:hypothetical protein [Cryobacterium sp. Hh38]TFD57098.1 hypothetical protein E3T41_13955 [Cryobacterium sp. Hh38]